jgi:hypothetical protein
VDGRFRCRSIATWGVGEICDLCFGDLVWDGWPFCWRRDGDGRSTMQAKPLMTLRRF